MRELLVIRTPGLDLSRLLLLNGFNLEVVEVLDDKWRTNWRREPRRHDRVPMAAEGPVGLSKHSQLI